MTLTTYRLKITGMTCSSCSTTIQGEFDEVPGLSYAFVDLDKHQGTIKFNKNTHPEYNIQKFIDLVEDVGFDAEADDSFGVNGVKEEVQAGAGNGSETASSMKSKSPQITIKILIDGMVCSSCSTTIQGELDDIENLDYAFVDLDNHNAVIKYREDTGYGIEKFIDIIGKGF